MDRRVSDYGQPRSSTTMAARVFRFLARSASAFPPDPRPGTSLSFARSLIRYTRWPWMCANATKEGTFYGLYRGIKRSNRPA